MSIVAELNKESHNNDHARLRYSRPNRKGVLLHFCCQGANFPSRWIVVEELILLRIGEAVPRLVPERCQLGDTASIHLCRCTGELQPIP